jgi:transcriptional regulator with XRE-family HTH domain
LEPKNRIAQARTDAGLSAKKFAEKLGVDTATVSNWETGRRQLTLDRLKQIAELLNVGVTFLLGLDERADYTAPVEKALLPALHRTPVWTRSRGWALVNAARREYIFADGETVSFEMLQEPVYAVPPPFALSLRGVGTPLSLNETVNCDRVWVEPITTDPELANELRGWYRPHGRRLVENEYGNRFYLDAYGAKWLAFENCME